MLVSCELQAFLICHFKTGASPKNGKPSETNLSRLSRSVQTRLICDNQKMPICSPQSSQCVYWIFAVEKMPFKHWRLYHLSESSRSWGLAVSNRLMIRQTLTDEIFITVSEWDARHPGLWMRSSRSSSSLTFHLLPLFSSHPLTLFPLSQEAITASQMPNHQRKGYND